MATETATYNNYRRFCLDRKGEKCVICGSTDDVVVHHVDGDRTNNDLSNLTPLCNDCHERVHTVPGDEQGDPHEQMAAELLPREERDTPGNGVRRTLHIPDAIDEQIKADLEHGDSYSARVQAALRAYYGIEEVKAE